ncbi:MAG TPA: right-handed parallel beta-helix repeat-containing protein [Tepidisphaeraceae bacterium]|nr:right-handed parallel beta-helix repeat-containing protein [Tepidisphaeraceae bacterium]
MVVAGSVASAAVYHVNPTGDDSAVGDVDHPWQTISRAANWAQAGDTVLIAPGIYREWVALAHSGEPNKPITFAAEKAGTVVITGADPLGTWVPVPDHPGQYITDWPHDFIVDHNPDGSPVRDHGAPAPVGCAEQILWQSHPLRQVMKSDDLSPGSFFVDWQYHTLTVWLPGGTDPRSGGVEGCVRSYLFSPLEKDDLFVNSRYITLRGLILQDAANFAQRGGVILGTGWQAINCTVENNNAGGLSLNGDDILVDHCIAQYNGFCGISGSGNNNTLQDCIVRGNNRKGFLPDWEGGGGKFLKTNHLRIIRHVSCDNTGPGLWLDTDNINYSITDSVFYGNHGLNDDRQGCGIYLEIDPGPGVVSNNICYSNTGGGITLAESSRITVEGNTLVDNGYGIELRNMPDRDNYHLRQITIEHNRFKEWRKAAIGTGLGHWTNTSAKDWGLNIDQNFYDPPHDLPFAKWADAPIADLPAMRSVLGLESGGSIQSILFEYSLENVKTISDSDRPTIARAMKDAAVGTIVTIPASCRSQISEGKTCAIFDQDNHCMMISVPDEWHTRLETAVSNWPSAAPVLLEVRIDQIAPDGDIRGTLMAVG